MMKIYLLFVIIITVIMAAILYSFKKNMHGNYNGIWFIITSGIYFCLVFIGALYFFGIPL